MIGEETKRGYQNTRSLEHGDDGFTSAFLPTETCWNQDEVAL